MNKHFEGNLPCQGALEQTAKTPSTPEAALGGVNSHVASLKPVWNHPWVRGRGICIREGQAPGEGWEQYPGA